MALRPKKTVRMTLDEGLVEALDRAARKLGTSRSAFTRDALREALTRVRTRRLEQRHRAGYTRSPVRRGEFGVIPGKYILNTKFTVARMKSCAISPHGSPSRNPTHDDPVVRATRTKRRNAPVNPRVAKRR